jgi:large subunit ribosomal protein L28
VAKVCYSCGKKPSFGNARSHSLKATRRRWNPNLQKVRIQEGSATKRVWVCASCLKGFKVQKARATTPPVAESA